jgi:ATP-binding cassette subfamily B protein
MLRLLFVFFNNGGDYIWTYLAIRILREICADAFARVQRYSAEWHANTFAGSTVRKITRGFWAFDKLGDSIYFHLLPSVAVVLGVLVTMTFRWPEMAAMFALGCALYCWVSIYLTITYFAPKRRFAVEYDTKLGGALADSITCNALVKSSGAERREDRRLEGVLDSWRTTHIRCWRAGIDTGVAQAVTMLAVQAVLLGIGLWLWQQGRASAGDVAYVLTSFMLVTGYLRDVGQHIREAQHAVNDLEDVVEYALTAPEVQDRPRAVILVVARGEIRFEGVRFCYPKSGEPVFVGFDLTIEPGEKVALVGHSGSGKSTFV